MEKVPGAQTTDMNSCWHQQVGLPSEAGYCMARQLDFTWVYRSFERPDCFISCLTRFRRSTNFLISVGKTPASKPAPRSSGMHASRSGCKVRQHTHVPVVNKQSFSRLLGRGWVYWTMGVSIIDITQNKFLIAHQKRTWRHEIRRIRPKKRKGRIPCACSFNRSQCQTIFKPR